MKLSSLTLLLKKPLLLQTGFVLTLATPIPALAQGTLDFKNFGPANLNAPVFLPDGVTKLSGTQFSATLLAGPTPSSLALIDTIPFLTNSQAGYFDGGAITIPSAPGGATAFVMVQFWFTKDIPSNIPATPTPAQPAEPLYPWLWGSSPEFSAVLGDPSAQPPTPGVLSGLGTAPLILSTPSLVAQLTATNTLAFSLHSDPNQYVLCARYALQHSSDPSLSNWTTTVALTNFANAIGVLPRPSTTTFYRLVMQ